MSGVTKFFFGVRWQKDIRGDGKNLGGGRKTSWKGSSDKKSLCWAAIRLDLFRFIIAGSLESAYSLNWGAQEIWGKSGGETLALL